MKLPFEQVVFESEKLLMDNVLHDANRPYWLMLAACGWTPEELAIEELRRIDSGWEDSKDWN